MKKVIYILIFSLFAAYTQAQEGGKPLARVFVENNYKPTENGIMIKWLARKVYYEEGINVYRKTANSNWEKLNSSPLKVNLNASLSDLNNDPEAVKFLEAVGKLSYKEFQGSIFRAFVLIKNILNTDFAIATSSAYVDKTALIGQSYTYKIMAIESGTEVEIALSKSITTSTYQQQKAPQNVEINLNFFDKAYELKWQPEELRYYGVMVKRSINGGPFEALNKAPIAAQKIETDSGEVYPNVFYKDFKIGEDTAYSYKLVGIDYFGQETEYTQAIDFPAQDFSFPKAPVNFNLKANQKEQSIQLSWELPEISEDAIGLKVYRIRSGDTVAEARSKNLALETRTFSDQLDATGGYSYYVVCIDDGGNESRSATIFTEIRDLAPPAVPSNFNITSDTGKFIFTWNNVSEKDLAGYFIYRSIADEDNTNNKFSPMNSDPIDTNYFVLPVSENVRNKFAYCVISADTNFNRSAFSEIKIAQLPDVEAPKTPLIKNVSIRDSVLLVEWLPNVDADLKGYHVFRKLADDTSDFQQLNFNLLPKSSQSYTDKQAEPGLKYAYCIKAVDENDLESDLSNVFKGRLPAGVPNIAPSDITIKLNNKKKQAKIEWKASEEEEMLVGYTVFRKSGKSSSKPVSGLLSDTKFVDNNLKKGETYSYEVRAYSKNGDVLKSEQKTIELKLTEN